MCCHDQPTSPYVTFPSDAIGVAVNDVRHRVTWYLLLMKIGIVPMSAKPFHLGHDMLVRLASRENDEVYLYVSTTTRDSVSGEAMTKIWKEQIEPSLPDNVKVTYGGSPVANAYKLIGEASKAGSKDTFRIYSDPEDAITNFPDENFMKYCGELFAAGRVMRRPVERTSTVDISGTKMRAFLDAGDKKSFMRYMPSDIDGGKVWDTLVSMKPAPKAPKGPKMPLKKPTKPVKGESLLRSLVRLLLQE